MILENPGIDTSKIVNELYPSQGILFFLLLNRAMNQLVSVSILLPVSIVLRTQL